MKGTLENGLFWVNMPEHIQAHLIICFMVLIMMRVIRHKMKKSMPEDNTKNFNRSYGMPGKKPLLKRVVIPQADIAINEGVFNACHDALTLYAPEGSTAQVYAQENGINFLPLE